MQSADITMTGNPGECLVRIYLRAKQGDNSERLALFTGLTAAPERGINGKRMTYNIECYSVLKPVSDVLIPRGFYVSAGANGADVVKELLSVGPAPVIIDGYSPALSGSIVSEDTMSRLDVAWMVLEAIGWRLKIDGDGTIHICAAASEPSAVFDMLDNDVIEMALTDAQDWYSVPNCIRVVSGDRCVEYKDIDPDSPVAIPARKQMRGGTGEIWMSDSASATGDNESLAEYAMRILRDAQAPARTITYTRRFQPDVHVTDLVMLRLPGIGINGTFRITSQDIELGYGCRTSEEVTAVE